MTDDHTTGSKRWLVTGGSQGIGAAIVSLAQRRGHQVVFTGRDAGRIKAVATDSGAVGVQADVSVPADNARTVETALERLGGIDVLINNAACGYDAALGEIDLDQMRRLFDTNVFGLVDVTNRVTPLMKRQQHGDIVNIASTSGMKGHPLGTAYGGSKWAVRGMTQCWQAELRPHGIRVTSICPSEVQTNWGGRTGRNNPNKLYAADIAETIVTGLALPPRVMWTELAVFATNPWKDGSA